MALAGRGIADGLTTHFRRRLRESCYLGVEIEINQKHARGDPASWHKLRRAVNTGLAIALAEYVRPAALRAQSAVL